MFQLVKQTVQMSKIECQFKLLLTSGSVLLVLESKINTITAPRSASMILELPLSRSVVSIQAATGKIR